jgi:hypothetical protein
MSRRVEGCVGVRDDVVEVQEFANQAKRLSLDVVDRVWAIDGDAQCALFLSSLEWRAVRLARGTSPVWTMDHVIGDAAIA